MKQRGVFNHTLRPSSTNGTNTCTEIIRGGGGGGLGVKTTTNHINQFFIINTSNYRNFFLTSVQVILVIKNVLIKKLADVVCGGLTPSSPLMTVS